MPPRRPGLPGRSRRPARTSPTAVAAVLLPLALLAGCLGDPPPAPEVAPLEVVVESRTRPEQPCLLNRTRLGAGDHEVILISERGVATVRILDPDGEVVFEDDTAEQRITEDEQGNVVIEGGEVPMAARLEAGRHRVVCHLRGSEPATAMLRVVPARPGFTETGER